MGTWKAEQSHVSPQVAFKQYLKARIDEVEYSQICREIAVHSGLSHRNVLDLFAAFEDDEAVYLVLEHCPVGDLFAFKRRAGGRLDERRCIDTVIHPMLTVLHFLHNNGIVHRDIKARRTRSASAPFHPPLDRFHLSCACVAGEHPFHPGHDPQARRLWPLHRHGVRAACHPPRHPGAETSAILRTAAFLPVFV